MSGAHREKLKRTFDQDAELYDKARPCYPAQIFDDLHGLACLGPEAMVLEVGCGTGQASLALTQKGYRLVCLELGEQLAAVARRKLAGLPRVEVVTSAFESWDPRGLVFDMVFAASSWHWLDSDVRYEKAARLLEPAGALVILSGGQAFPDDFDPFFTEIQSCYEGLGEPRLDWPPPRPDQIPDQREEIEKSGLFEIVEVRRYVWSIDYSAESYIDLLDTYSGHIVWPQWKRDKLHAEVRKLISKRPEERIRMHYLSILHVCRLIP